MPSDFVPAEIENVEAFVRELPAGPRWAFEVRSREWFVGDVRMRLRDALGTHGVALAVTDSTFVPLETMLHELRRPTASHAYVRWLGGRDAVARFTRDHDRPQRRDRRVGRGDSRRGPAARAPGGLREQPIRGILARHGSHGVRGARRAARDPQARRAALAVRRVIRLDEAEVERRLERVDVAGAVRDALIAAANGDGGGPVRASCTTPSGVWFAAMPAWCGGERAALGAKLVVAVPANARRGLPTHRAVVVLFDPATGEPAAWIDAEALTRARTAAASVVATTALATRPRGAHAVLGAGAQGVAHVAAFARAGMVERLAVWSRTRAHADALAAFALERGVTAHVEDSADEAVRGADVVTTCTASAEPLFAAASVADGAHVNAVGACVAHKRELPGALVGAAALAVDDLDAARAEAGDVILAVHDGDASWDGVVTLGDVLARRASARAGRVSVFVSLGVGVEDVATAAAVLRA